MDFYHWIWCFYETCLGIYVYVQLCPSIVAVFSDCLTNRVVDGDLGAFGVFVVRHGEHAGVAARVLRVFGVHQAQRAVSKRDPEAVQLHMLVPRRRGVAVPRAAVVGEDVGGVLAVGEAPLEGGVVEVRRGRAGDGQISRFSPSYFYQRGGVVEMFEPTDHLVFQHIKPQQYFLLPLSLSEAVHTGPP